MTGPQLAALQTIRDRKVSFCSVPGAPGRARYRYYSPGSPASATPVTPACWLSIPTPTVTTLLGHGLVKHGARQIDRTEWSEPVSVTLQGDLALRGGAKAAAKTQQRTDARARDAAARTAAAKLPPPPVDLDALVASVPGAGRAWVLSVPPVQLLNANDRLVREAEATRVKSLRKIGWQLALAADIPGLRAAHVIYVVHLNTRASKGDPGNLAPTAKALLDGVVDAGVLPDDNAHYVVGPMPHAGQKVSLKGGRISLVLIDLPEGIPAP